MSQSWLQYHVTSKKDNTYIHNLQYLEQARYKVYIDHILEVYRVDSSILETPLSSLVLNNTSFFFILPLGFKL